MRVVLAGGEAAGVRALRLLVDRGLSPIAVAAADDGMATAADQAGVAVVDSATLAEAATARWVADQQIDLLINAHSLHIVDGNVLAALRIGGYNLHPGPLPTYAGLNAPSWAIINGEQRHAVTLHEMTSVVDAGGIVSATWFDLDDRSTGLSVSSRCARLGITLLEDLVDRLINGSPITSSSGTGSITAAPIATTAITGERRLYRRADRPYGGRVPWREPVSTIDRLIRGCSFHPMPSPIGTPTTTSTAGDIGILSGGPIANPNGANTADRPLEPGLVICTTDHDVLVGTGDGFYRIDRVTKDGQAVDAADVLTTDQILA
jgi:methionyl-tRNA formyltransferase